MRTKVYLQFLSAPLSKSSLSRDTIKSTLELGAWGIMKETLVSYPVTRRCSKNSRGHEEEFVKQAKIKIRQGLNRFYKGK